MTVLQIQCFLTVCRCRKYSEAAERLGLPQSALFKQLKAMEDEFSVRLFEKENLRKPEMPCILTWSACTRNIKRYLVVWMNAHSPGTVLCPWEVCIS